ncbi:MAG: ABC transporter ATP-binding protein [Acidimicrobiales bacterium]
MSATTDESAPTEVAAGPSPAQAATDPVLVVEDLRVHFETDAGTVKAVDGMSFAIGAGETVALVGESGSGKSVTGMSLIGLLPKPVAHTTGSIRWKGQELVGASDDVIRKVRGREISMIFQDALTALNPVLTVGRQISEMVRVHLGASKRDARARAIEMLEAVGIPEPRKRFDQYPHEFSGGMRQRAMIAMAISCDPQLIIADEPTTALDVTVQAQVLEVLAEIQERTGAAVILVTHDLGVVAGVADRVMVMYAGRQVETAATDDVFYRGRHPYTVGLMASVPRVDRDGVVADDDGTGRLKPIDGQPPSLLHPPSGCSFHPRCELRGMPSPCGTVDPPLLEVAPGHWSACHFADRLIERATETGSDLAAVAAAIEAQAGDPEAEAAANRIAEAAGIEEDPS